MSQKMYSAGVVTFRQQEHSLQTLWGMLSLSCWLVPPPSCLDIIDICELEGFLFNPCVPLKMVFGVEAIASLSLSPRIIC